MAVQAYDKALEVQGPRSVLGIELHRALASPALVIGLCTVLGFAIVAAMASAIAPHDPLYQDYDHLLAEPGAHGLLGTDDLGRDTFSRLVHGSRYAFGVAGTAVIFSLLLGVPLGVIGGYVGGRADYAVTIVMDALYAFPTLVLALAIVAAVGPGAVNVVIAIGVTSSPVYARLIRSQTLSVKQSDYVRAAKALGAGHGRVMIRHILPNVMAPVIVQASLGMAFALLAEAGLSFLGVGINPPAPTWGAMLQRGFPFLAGHPWMSFAPGLAILALALGFNFLGDGLRDVLDPRLRRG